MWEPPSNKAVEPTPNSLRSCLAAALGRGSPRALGRMNTELAPQVHEFADLAAQFCAWCEADSLGTEPLRNAAAWLAQLYAAAIALPDVEPATDGTKPEVPEECCAKVKRNFAPFWTQDYRQVFDPRPECDDAPICQVIGDDLTDVYHDVKGALLLYQRGDTIDAAWQWRFDHQTHWGHHVVGALFGIHGLVIAPLA